MKILVAAIALVRFSTQALAGPTAAANFNAFRPPGNVLRELELQIEVAQQSKIFAIGQRARWCANFRRIIRKDRVVSNPKQQAGVVSNFARMLPIGLAVLLRRARLELKQRLVWSPEL